MDKKNYTETLNLPKTEFPMRGNLPEREPYFIARAEENGIYKEILNKNKKTGKKFILHDGPPYANGNIHMGHAFNKILKDIIVRYKSMNGYYSPYVPGWDTHGLPIEKKVQQEKKIKKDDVGALKFRQICKEYALAAVDNQAEQFKRLGGLGDYDNVRYLTLNKKFEVEQIETFWQMYKNGYIYRDLKPVYWCPECETALAEAEIEYADKTDKTAYVKFRLNDDLGKLSKYGNLKNTYIIIWTTTPWTLPGNQAITVNKDFDYAIVKVEENGEENTYIFANDLVEKVMEKASIVKYQVIGKIKGEQLEGMTCKKPLDETKLSRVILGSDKDLIVELDTGTGCVHTAPGHGNEDFLACRRYEGIEVIVPVDKHGYMTSEAGIFEGLSYKEANEKILEYLKENNMLFASEVVTHSYPNCWRCKNPIIYRATTQWFASVDKFRDRALEEVKKVKWYPSWGAERMTNMIKDRTDWCISRQRTWGVPIPIFYSKKDGKEVINQETIDMIKKKVSFAGTDMWYDLTAEEILGKELIKKYDLGELEKETDIMDVWFDSGTTYKSVLKEPEYEIETDTADVYLEGNDQFRGWFQSSLLTSVATENKAPYKQVITHGFLVDGQGRKMSKSLGNGVDPLEVTKEFGADILRLWTVSSDYHSEMKVSNEILTQVAENYKKIRNTLRFLLGNLNDFNPTTDMIKYEERNELDRYARYKLNELVRYTVDAYENYEFNLVYTELHRFCTVELSNKYLDIIKDRLYTFKKESHERRSSQSTMYEMLSILTRIMAPILSFTAEEVWTYMVHTTDDSKLSVMLSDFPHEDNKYFDDQEMIQKWNKIFDIKEKLAKDIEEARANKIIGNALDARVEIYTSKEDFAFISENIKDIQDILIVSGLEVFESEEYKVVVDKAYGDKCERCWTYSTDVGKDRNYPTLCKKCVNNLK